MATNDSARGAQPTTERPSLTTFRIFEAADETLVDWKYLGEIPARDREHAIRLYFPDPEKVVKGVRVAVSVNGWKPVMVGQKPVKPRLDVEDVAMPGSTPPAAETTNTTVTTVTTTTTDEPAQLTGLAGGKAAASA